MESLSSIVKNIKDKDFFCILTHNYPDGDAVGSAVGLCHALQKIGKHAKVNFGYEIPEKFKFLLDYIAQDDFIPQSYISVDLADIGLLHESVKGLSENIDFCIDHHKSNKNYAKQTFLDATSAANCEIIFEMLGEFGCDLDKELAECLYVGIATDTGGFMYSNVTARTHKIVSEILGTGIDSGKINEKLFILEPKKHFELVKIIYNNLKFYFDDKVAVTCITLSEMSKIGITDSELDGIASIPIKIEGVEMGITVREKPNGMCKVSVRTRSRIDADEFCKVFDGGGHERAGGFSVSGNASGVTEKIKKSVADFTGW
ncbi:MAG: bifunctional oligoribonuclease/PAP phosphatase NrnA [Clostridia bacterium]|nr:bifunctional oligoribonuclease/PAP phosphatase NrnA [Clostridia bacterium]MBR2734990.1 bifunctional oligoribonuclease/PAP phosphatase NrnA [Clostridia bacterium]